MGRHRGADSYYGAVVVDVDVELVDVLEVEIELEVLEVEVLEVEVEVGGVVVVEVLVELVDVEVLVKYSGEPSVPVPSFTTPGRFHWS